MKGKSELQKAIAGSQCVNMTQDAMIGLNGLVMKIAENRDKEEQVSGPLPQFLAADSALQDEIELRAADSPYLD